MSGGQTTDPLSSPAPQEHSEGESLDDASLRESSGSASNAVEGKNGSEESQVGTNGRHKVQQDDTHNDVLRDQSYHQAGTQQESCWQNEMQSGAFKSALTKSYSAVVAGTGFPSAPDAYNLRSTSNVFQVDFYLYIHCDENVKEAYILFGDGEPLLLRQVRPKLWHHQLPLNCHVRKEYVEYRYRIFIKGHSSNIPFIGRLLSKNDLFVDELGKRKIASHIQHDVFHFPEDRNYYIECIPQSVMFYVKWSLQHVNLSDISQNLLLEQMSFKRLSRKHVREFIVWIMDQITGPSVTDAQRVYLSVVLAHLSQSNSYFDLRNGDTTRKACDRVLECFRDCVSFSRLSSLKILEEVALLLVRNSSCPAWLNLAAIFYPYLGERYLVKKRCTTTLNYTCDAKEYHKLVDLLLKNIDIKSDGKTPHQDLLLMALELAPDNEAVVKLFENSDTDQFFDDEVEKENFFVKFYQGANSRCESGGVGARLVELVSIPSKLREKLYLTVNSSLLDFVRFDGQVKKKHVEAFVNLVVLDCHLKKSQVCDLLLEVSKSKLSSLRKLLLTILNNPSFEFAWHNMPFAQKLKICTTWVITEVVDEKRRDPRADKTTLVYRGVELLMTCRLNVSNKPLAEETSDSVIKQILKNEDPLSVFKAFVCIEKCSVVVRECYKIHVKEILNPRLAKKSYKVFEEFSNSSFGHELLPFVLDMLDIPIVAKEASVSEDAFKKILEWCDVWTILLKASGSLEDSTKFKDGKNICQQLKSCIEKGNLSQNFLEVIQKNKKNVAVLCASTLVKSTPSSAIESLKIDLVNRINELANAVRDCSEKFNLLESVINYGRKISDDVLAIDGFQTLVEQFNERKSHWGTKKVMELQNDSFWGPLLPLIRPAATLQPLMNSLSFITVARKGLKGSTNGDGNECPVNDFYSVINFLTNNAIEELQALWNPVLKDPGSLSVQTMKMLLGTVKHQNGLDQELKLLEKYFQRTFSPDVKTYIDDYVKYPSVVKQVQHVIGILSIFGLSDSSLDMMVIFSQFETMLDNVDQVTLATLHKSIEDVTKMVSAFSGQEFDCVIEELSRSSELLTFIEKVVDEDIRFLIDAVEEHSDQFVSESSVSDLIDVHGFLAPLIKKKRQKNCNAQDFLKMLKTSCLGHNDIAVKIQQCSTNVNSLRGLYTSIANRGEITREIINNCLSKGFYLVSLTENGKCEANMSYVLRGSAPTNYYLSDLQDLRSRAHLIVSSRNNAFKVSSTHSKESSDDIDFDDFICQINLLTEITTLLCKLRFSGYENYRKFWRRMRGTQNLQTNRDNLQQDLETWESILASAREDCYFLNYYRSNQLCVLYDSFTNKSNDGNEVLSLIHFVDRSINKQYLKEHQEELNELEESHSNSNPSSFLSIVGRTLEKIFIKSKRAIRSIPEDAQSQSYTKLKATVTLGEIFVASLEPDSSLTANVILTLYENTSHSFPEPYQIVFCSSHTTWEEIHLLLQRCFLESKYVDYRSLFCIANVELLPNELQFKLVDAIKDKQNIYQNSADFQKCADYQLALICRGGDHHHIVEQFAQYSHHIAGMSDHVLSHRLKSSWPEVKMITSALPGLGKTEQIKHEALRKNMNIATFSISGPFEPSKLIQRLKKLNLKKYHCLHLDVGEVDKPHLLDMFLFQLIVTGMVSAGSQFYHLPTSYVRIEIANTLKDWLRESLVVSKYFTRIHLEWQNYKDLLVSMEITSNIQIVCQYLDCFDRACLESEEVCFSESKTQPLPPYRCRELLAKHFSSDAEITFTALNTFLSVFADQLLKFSKSAYFKIARLKSMLGKGPNAVRTNLFCALLQVSKEFASRAIRSCRTGGVQQLSQEECAKALDRATASTTSLADEMVKRVKDMIHWEDSNHLLVVFHGLNSQAITAVYRNRTLVPSSVKKLLKSQAVRGNKELEDFKSFTQEKLQEQLEKIACMNVKKKNNLFVTYALTPDNVLKMLLIILRVRANAPVIIMGETGCGKTSLVRYLANTCGIRFYVFNFHAGIFEEDIIKFIKGKESEARTSGVQTWIFLDEINTCEHLGLISDIMCHHSLLGRPLSKNLVFLAACNPYKERPQEHIKTAGLEGKNITDEYSGLVYRVHPLPEAMIDYVWDYGSLAPKDERDYIQRMVGVLPKTYEGLLVDLLASSQEFTRKAEKNDFCVSLRDVHRCILLIGWFQDMHKKREKSQRSDHSFHLQKYYVMSERYDDMIKSIVLALAHCYLSRLPTAELRKSYQDRMMYHFSRNGHTMISEGSVDNFSAIVRVEQEDYLDRMELPAGTAKNAALRENVFVMLVCILNRIPVFVVGKPGCSKSLSIQLIRSNLRGRDSRDPLFRQLPQLYVVSYQGSESSTSEGIIKVFEKARKYKSHNNDGNVLPVVLLDEVGLAENSKYNPLKVLHSLLEPGEGKLPDVAVVGVSNWSLDAAKMNRAIHLSRPEPTKEDLYETGRSLHRAGTGNNPYLGKRELQCLAEAYSEYQLQQSHANFHGLRDYYSLIKSLTGCSNFEQVNISLQRNFGGLPNEVTNIQKIFLNKLKKYMTSSGEDIIPVTKLIQENLADFHARHLMLITSGDSAIGILKQSISQLQKETITIYGSRFEEDLSEEYNYRILSRIILCMERDCILILRDLESIYGSLYDMLNQNYAVVGNRKNCRVALGAYSNPMCQVNDGFRCIVLIDQDKVDYSDPPFLNRFEKQLLRFSDVLTEDQNKVLTELSYWLQEICSVDGLESHFKESDMFIGFHEDTLPSLVLSHGDSLSPEEVLAKCKDDLMWIASPDGVLRMQKCRLLKEDFHGVQELSDQYFEKPLHQGLAAFMDNVVDNYQKSSFFASDEIGSRTVIMTFSNIHTDIQQCLGSGFKTQVERLSAYKSEKQLAERIDEFWNTPEKELLVLQCKPDLDGAHLLLARSIIEEKRNSYKHILSGEAQEVKHVCIVVHVQRGEDAESFPWQFSFQCGWRQVFLDVLEAPLVPLNEILGKSVQKLLTSSIWPIREIARKNLLWCFTCIKYTRNERPVNTILNIAKNLFNSDEVSQAIEELILRSIDLDVFNQTDDVDFKDSWQVKVACDRQSLINSSTLYCAMDKFVSRLVLIPLAKIVYFLEKENAWPPHLVNESDSKVSEFGSLWCTFTLNKAIFNISDIPEPRGAESYTLDSAGLDLSLPFSQVVIKKVDSVKELFLEDHATLLENEENVDENGQLMQNLHQEQLQKFSEMILYQVPELLCYTSTCQGSYMKDCFDLMTSDFSSKIDRSQRVSIAQAVFLSEFKRNLPTKDMPEFFAQLHTFVWVHREQVLDLLKMVECCSPFIHPDVVASVIDVTFGPFEEIMFFESDMVEREESGCLGENSKEQDDEDKNADEERHFPLETNIGHETESDNNETGLAGIKLEFEMPIENTQESVSEENSSELNEPTESFGEILVTAYCEEMFPSLDTVQKHGGLESWIRHAKLLISLAFNISEHSYAFHYLRLCLDFSQIILASNALPRYLSSLYILKEISNALKPKYLDHEESFQEITDRLIKPLKIESANHSHEQRAAFHKFLAFFYGRCIDTNVDTSCARQIVEHVLSLDQPELVMMMGPVVLRLLMVEEMQSPGVFFELISEPSVIENCPCLQNIDEVFKDLFNDGLIHHDSYSSVLICDLIQSLMNFADRYSIEDLDSSDCEVLTLAKSASFLLSKNNKDSCGLAVLSAVAFLRGYFTMLAEFIVQQPNVLTDESPFTFVMIEIDSLLKGPNSSLQIFFLKQLTRHANLYDVQKWCAGSNTITTIKQLSFDNENPDKAVFTSVLKYPEYEEVKAAYWNLTHHEESAPMEDLLTKCSKSPNHAYALLGILVNTVFLKRAVRRLTDRQEQVVSWFAGKVTLFPSLFQELMLRIIGRRDFHCPQLQLSPESSVEDVQVALLIVHIACMIATSALEEDLPMYRYFTNPLAFAHPCVLAHREEGLHSVLAFLPSRKTPSPVTCTCGLRLAFEDAGDGHACPHCHEVWSSETLANTRTDDQLSCFSKAENKMPEWDACLKHMNPAVYRALHLIVYSSYYAGVAIGTSMDGKLSGVLHLLTGFVPDTESSNSASVSFCFENIKSDLSYLMEILCCEKEVAIKAMHLVVENSSKLLRRNMEGNNCSTPEMRRRWEEMFSLLVQPVFSDARRSQELEKLLSVRDTNFHSDDISVERMVLELDAYPSDIEKHSQQCKRLYRLTKQPSFQDFRSAFFCLPKEVREKHSFLTLFFAKFDQLPIISHLHHILKWTRLVSAALSHRVSRKDAQSRSIDDFISGHLLELNRSQREIERLKELFNSFKKAWNELRPLINERLVDKEEMPRLRETDHVAYCLVESDYGIYLLSAITILVSIQNSFVDEILCLSSSHQQPALSFLEKDKSSGVMSVSIQDVKEKELINFQWSPDLFKYAQSNLEYGKGCEIQYDFERMEIELASQIVLGKCHLTGTLNKFIFTKELFHSCGPLLSEIRSLVTQSASLPDAVCEGLSSLKERRIKEAQDLLQHIEVLIFLLKPKLKNFDANMTLEELIENWLPMLPSPFPVDLLPQPRSSIKVTHVVALYEALEDVLADGAIEGLADKFSVSLPMDVKEKLKQVSNGGIDQLKPHNFLKALRRFVFRYLSSDTERFWPDESTTLQSCLKEPSLWAPIQPPKFEDVPKEITLEYIHSVVKYLEELNKEMKGNNRRSTTRPRQSQTVKQAGRRRIKKFSCA